ncbi:ketosamine-3-kinase-like isoform X2 [Tachypleus tridentatus]
MEEKIKVAMNTKKLERTGRGGGGCINEGECYMTDNGHVFVKRNTNQEMFDGDNQAALCHKTPNKTTNHQLISSLLARRMFDGELEGLKALLVTKSVRVPEPYMVIDNPDGGAVLVMEYIDMKSLIHYSSKLGELLAKMHLHNAEIGNRIKAQASSIHKSSELEDQFVSQFGFHTITCCGYIPQDNTWHDDWVEFFARQRLQHQLNFIEKNYRDREAQELWSQLQLILPKFFKDISIVPAIVHGDLWGGNAAETDNEPVIFDPAAFYAHSEFELGITTLFGGFSRSFFDSYHSAIPKAPGFEYRLQLYQLFNYLNHWNHFGGGYRGSSISLMKRLLKS